MRTEAVEIYSDRTNMAVMRHPGRKFPGVLVQGDDLYALCRAADEASSKPAGSEAAGFWLNQLKEALHFRLEHYRDVLNEHGIAMPFDDRPHTAPQGETK